MFDIVVIDLVYMYNLHSCQQSVIHPKAKALSRVGASAPETAQQGDGASARYIHLWLRPGCPKHRI